MKTRFFSITFLALALIIFISGHAEINDPIVNDVLTYTNQARQKKGLKPLVMRENLNGIARSHSDNMASGKVPFSHDGFTDRYKKARTELKSVYGFAENVSFGPHNGKEAVEGWMNSPHHRDNILGDYTSIGIGVGVDKNGVYYFTQVFCKE
ncbi:MAG: CAP domain-containing protein [Chitinophagaceae bacterium]